MIHASFTCGLLVTLSAVMVHAHVSFTQGLRAPRGVATSCHRGDCTSGASASTGGVLLVAAASSLRGPRPQRWVLPLVAAASSPRGPLPRRGVLRLVAAAPSPRGLLPRRGCFFLSLRRLHLAGLCLNGPRVGFGGDDRGDRGSTSRRGSGSYGGSR